MKINYQGSSRFVAPRLRTMGTVVFAAVLIAAGLSADAPSANVLRVEEDWVLVVNHPNTNRNGPQVTCAISPAGKGSAYCAFEINYRTQPDYASGGLQMHVWDPLNPIVVAESPHAGTMSTSNETVSWTQTMTLVDGQLTFRVTNGQSATWGSFGQSAHHLRIALPASLTNLNSYDPQVSVETSGVSFASNLVDSLTLVAVRWYDADGNLIKQVTTPQAVHPRS